MFRKIVGYVSLVVVMVIVVGCDEGGESENREDQLSATWVFERVLMTTINDSDGSESVSLLPFENSDYEIEFSKGGDFTIRNDGTALEGYWEFGDGAEVVMSWDDSSIPDSTFTILLLDDDRLWTHVIGPSGSGSVETIAQHVRN